MWTAPSVAPPEALTDYYRRVDAGDFDELVRALPERVVFEVAGGADREGSRCTRYEGRESIRLMLAQRGVLPIVHRPVYVGSAGPRAWLVEGVATDRSGAPTAQFIVAVDLDGTDRLVGYRAYACPATPMMPSSGGEVGSLSNDRVHELRRLGFGAFDRISERAQGSVVVPVDRSWRAVQRVMAADGPHLAGSIDAMLGGAESLSVNRVVDATRVTLFSGALVDGGGRRVRTLAARLAVDRAGSLAELLVMTVVPAG